LSQLEPLKQLNVKRLSTAIISYNDI